MWSSANAPQLVAEPQGVLAVRAALGMHAQSIFVREVRQRISVGCVEEQKSSAGGVKVWRSSEVCWLKWNGQGWEHMSFVGKWGEMSHFELGSYAWKSSENSCSLELRLCS